MISVNANAKKADHQNRWPALIVYSRSATGAKRPALYTSVHVKFNEKNDGGKTPQSAHVTMSIRDDGGKKA